MCLLCSACSAYFHISCNESTLFTWRWNGGGGLHCCHVFKSATNSKFCWRTGLLHTLWHGIISRLSGEKFNMIQVNTFPSLVPRPHPRGESLVTFGKSLGLHHYLGRISIRQSHCRKHHLWFQHWKPLATSAWWQQFLARKKLAISSQLQAMMKPGVLANYHLMGGVLARNNLMNLMVDNTALCS